MIRQTIYLEEWDWLCRIFYEVTPYDYEEICDALEEIDCDEDTMRSAKINILQGQLNTGFTFSNLYAGLSVIVISKTTDAEEFQSTFDHEKGHLAMHICTALRIPPFGEQCQYLTGEIGRQMFRKAKHLLCSECRKKAGL